MMDGAIGKNQATSDFTLKVCLFLKLAKLKCAVS